MTKKPNPDYLAEVFIKVNVINFTATFDGLNDQLLAKVVFNERPEIEKESLHTAALKNFNLFLPKIFMKKNLNLY